MASFKKFFKQVGKTLYNVVTLGGGEEKKRIKNEIKRDIEIQNKRIEEARDKLKKKQEEAMRSKKRSFVKGRIKGRSSTFFNGDQLGVINNNIRSTLG